MQGLQFESLTESLLRLPDVIKSIPDVLANPQANPLQAAILLGIAVVLVLVLLLSIVLVFIRPPAEEYEEYEEYEEGEPYAEAEEYEYEEVQVGAAPSWLMLTCFGILLFALVWVAAGVSSSSNQVCLSCHVDTPHDIAKTDPHADVACVDCHESGSPIARLTVNLVTRIQHAVLARSGSDSVVSYGTPVPSDACMRCHHKQIDTMFYDSSRKVRVSHKEAIAGGAECVDCHALTKSGIVTAETVGMSPCLRCHDGKQAKADCAECHIGDPSSAIVPSVPANAMAAAQVPNPQCGGCHKDMTVCDKCHGLRMPHSDTFMAYAHARPAAIDIWFGSGKLCQKCHYEGHNNCVQQGCHQTPLPYGHPNPAWATLHAVTRWDDSRTTCSCHQWNPWDHNNMNYCEICHPTKPKNAR